MTAQCCSGTGSNVPVPASTVGACTGSWKLKTCSSVETCISFECFNLDSAVYSRTQDCYTYSSFSDAMNRISLPCTPLTFSAPTGPQSETAYMPSASSSSGYSGSPSYSDTSDDSGPIIGGAVGGGAVVLAILAGACFCWYRRKQQAEHLRQENYRHQQQAEDRRQENHLRQQPPPPAPSTTSTTGPPAAAASVPAPSTEAHPPRPHPRCQQQAESRLQKNLTPAQPDSDEAPTDHPDLEVHPDQPDPRNWPTLLLYCRCVYLSLLYNSLCVATAAIFFRLHRKTKFYKNWLLRTVRCGKLY